MKLRAIRYARNANSRNVVYDSSITFSNGDKESFLFQNKVLTDEISLECICCERALTVSYMPNELGYKTFYFKHKNTDEECDLLICKNNLEKEELEQIYSAPESPKHKYIKNFLRENFLKNPEIEILSFDDKFILDCYKKRKPDIFIFYKGKEIVFEVQVSNLSLKYINARTKFYNEKKIYVIWLLDGFSQSENFLRNIKYINKNQNIFSFSDNQSKLFICKYKVPYIYEGTTVREKYKIEEIRFEDLTFDNDFEVFYFPYLKNKIIKENELVALKEKKLRIEEINKNREIILKVNVILENLRQLIRDKENFEKFKSVNEKIDTLDFKGINFLNKKIEKKTKYYFFEIIKNATEKSQGVLKFFLLNKKLKFNINDLYEQKSLIELMSENKNFIDIRFNELFHLIIDRGYEFKSNDYDKLENLFSKNKFYDIKDYNLLKLYIQLENKALKEYVFDYYWVIMLIKSIIAGKIIGCNYKENEWIQFFNLVYKNKKDCFGYVVDIIKKENKTDYFVNLKKGETLKEKIKEAESYNLKNDEKFKIIFEDLFEDYLWI